jgi:hypothetical protein
MAHAGWHCLTLLTFMQDHPELDDRYPSVKKRLDESTTTILQSVRQSQQTINSQPTVALPPFDPNKRPGDSQIT